MARRLPRPRRAALGPLLAAAGLAAGALAVGLDPGAGRAALDQDWPPFVLVAGLLLVGLVADADGLFAAVGARLARRTAHPVAFAAAVVVVTGAVTAVLNLDTAVAFLTPVLVYAGRRRGAGEAVALYGVLMLANAGSLLLPGSNLTNLIVLGARHYSGAQFVARTWLASLAALGATAVCVVVAERADARVGDVPEGATTPRVRALGVLGAAAAAAAVLALGDPALWVLGVGVAVVAARLATRSVSVARAREALGLSTLAGLFGVAVALGVAGREWGALEHLSHLDTVATAGAAALATVLVNNLPAASLFAAHAPSHPFALLVGLNLGPNLAATGSLAWVIWWRAARSAGARPSLARAGRIGLVAVPVSMALALGALALTARGA